jgi:hypothetical protein
MINKWRKSWDEFPIFAVDTFGIDATSFGKSQIRTVDFRRCQRTRTISIYGTVRKKAQGLKARKNVKNNGEKEKRVEVAFPGRHFSILRPKWIFDLSLGY